MAGGQKVYYVISAVLMCPSRIEYYIFGSVLLLQTISVINNYVEKKVTKTNRDSHFFRNRSGVVET